MVIVASFVKFCVTSHRITIRNIKESGQNYYTRTGPTKPQNSWWCLPAPPCLMSKDGVFIA